MVSTKLLISILGGNIQLIYSNSKLGHFKATSVVDCGVGFSKSRAKETNGIFQRIANIGSGNK